jgi:hypothetical protein
MPVKKQSIIALVVATGMTYALPAAGAQSGHAADLIPAASEVTSATIVLTPPGLFTRSPLTERQMLAYGCHFTADSERVAHLIDIVRNGVQDDDGRVSKFHLRNAIYLHLKSGSVIRYTFSDTRNHGQQIYGWIDHSGPDGGMYFFAQSGWLEDLKRWSLDDSVEKKDPQWCVENK